MNPIQNHIRFIVTILVGTAIIGCVHHPKPVPHDTAALNRNLTTARNGLTGAEASAGRVAGHLDRARTLRSRVDAKAEVVLEYLNSK